MGPFALTSSTFWYQFLWIWIELGCVRMQKSDLDHTSLLMIKTMGPKSSSVALRHSVPPGFENRLLRPHYKNLFDKWGIQGQEGHNCPTKSNFNPSLAAQANLVPPAISRARSSLGSYTPTKYALPHHPKIEHTIQKMRKPSHECIHEYIATTPQFDMQGHQIFPTY